MEYNLKKSFFIAFGTRRFDNMKLSLNDQEIQLKDQWNYLDTNFTYDLNMNKFFKDKMRAVTKAYFSLGFYPGGVCAFTQAKIYISLCLSLILYGLEVFSLNKTT